jgi:hypothetical protein
MDFNDFFDDLDIEDFAIIGGIVGYAEEELEELKRIELEQEVDEETEEDDIEKLIP